MTEALQSLRVVDFTWVLAGPYATRILADFGAQVIKIQSKTVAKDADTNLDGYFNTWNRNKLGITLNLNKPKGIDIVKKLVYLSDVVVENFSPRVMNNWGLGYDVLSRDNQGLIMLSMSGMGHTGIWKDHVAFGPTIQALSGLTKLTGFQGQPPVGVGYSYADHVAGLTAALAVIEALEYRRRTGKGQYIDLSELESMAALLGVTLLNCNVNQDTCDMVGNRSLSRQAAPHNVYRCAGDDRWCAVCVFTEEEWQAFCRVIGDPSWIKEERFSNLSNRMEHVDDLDRLVEEWTSMHTAEEVMTLLQQSGVPAGVVQDAKGLRKDPQLNSRGFYAKAEHPVLGTVLFDGNPIKLSATPPQFDNPAPLLGQHNEYVYSELLGMSAEEIESYKQEGVFD